MIFHFHAPNVAHFDEDKTYFEQKMAAAIKFLGSLAGDDDTVEVTVHLDKNKHQSGERFEAKAHVAAPKKTFDASVSAENIKKCADVLANLLTTQIKKHHDKMKG